MRISLLSVGAGMEGFIPNFPLKESFDRVILFVLLYPSSTLVLNQSVLVAPASPLLVGSRAFGVSFAAP